MATRARSSSTASSNTIDFDIISIGENCAESCENATMDLTDDIISVDDDCSAPLEDATIDLTDDVLPVDDDCPEPLEDITIDLTENALSNALLSASEIALDRLRTGGRVFSPGDFVEVQGEQMGSYPVDFLQIKTITETQAREYILRGIPYARTRNLHGQLPRKRNEVCMLRLVDCTNGVRGQAAYLDIAPAKAQMKRSLVMTNDSWPTHSHALRPPVPVGGTFEDKRRLQKRRDRSGHLTCRWKLTVFFAKRGQQVRSVEEALEALLGADVPDSRFRVGDEIKKNRWHGIIQKGGSWSKDGHVIDLDVPTQAPNMQRTGQRYTFFDSFSGAGGVSRGAKRAGLKVLYAVDEAPAVWETYTMNFPEATLFRANVADFIQANQQRVRVDVLHLSPPCQFFSPAHTRDSSNDQKNIDAQLSCDALIQKTRPRLVTLEQTFGISQERHSPYFRKLIGQMTHNGYSIRWSVVRLSTWGSAQDRKRLIMIAASPGHGLPPLPRATHSETGGPGLQKFRTMGDALKNIPRGHDLHDVGSAKRFHPPRAPFDAGKLIGTITTKGAALCHPSGTRELTLRELACLQGFPLNHRFIGNKSSICRQIGNAFPPNTVEVLYSHLRLWLLEEDGLKPFQPPSGRVFVIDRD